jgi:hypothetical protein
LEHRRAIFRHQSRRAIAWSFCLFAVGQLAAGLALDYLFPLTRFPSAAKALERADAEPEPPAVIFFGSSRTESAVVPAEANRILAIESKRSPSPRVLNASVVAGDSLSAEFVFERILARGTKPECVVLEVSPEMLTDRPPFMREHAVRQLKWSHLFTDLPTILRANAGWMYVEGRLAPVYTHRRQLVREGKSAIREWLPAPGMTSPAAGPAAAIPGRPAAPDTDPGSDLAPGFAAPSPAATDESLLLKQSQYGAEKVVRRWLRDYRIGGPAPPALERILDRCRSEGIRVILLGIPACSAHRNEFMPAVEAAYTGYVDRLVREYGCQFVDARDWVPDTSFGDTLHVRSDTGGVAFTARFSREVLLPELK